MSINEQARNRWSLISLREGIISTDISKKSKFVNEDVAMHRVPSSSSKDFKGAVKFASNPPNVEVTTTKTTMHGLIIEDIFEFTYVPETLEISYGAKYTKGKSSAADAFSPSITYTQNSVMSIQFTAIFHGLRTVSPFIAVDQLLSFMVPRNDLTGSISAKGSPRKLLLSGPRLSLPFSRFERKIVNGQLQAGSGPAFPFSALTNSSSRLGIDDTITPVVLTKLDADMSLFSPSEDVLSATGNVTGDFPKHIEVNLGFLVFILPVEVKDSINSSVTRPSSSFFKLPNR